jgi:ferric-dicitrate binding protein FerR (iron transport regulator)
VADAVVLDPLTLGEEALPRRPARQPRPRRRLVLTVLAVVVFIAALLVLGLYGLIPFGLLLAFSTHSDEEGTRRSVNLTRRNLGLAAAMVLAFAWFWL